MITYLGKEDEFDHDIGVPLLGCIDDEKCSASCPSEKQIAKVNSSTLGASSSCCKFLSHFVGVLELPLSLPRRLTIPVVSEESWSKPMAVISVTLVPILAAVVLSTPSEGMDSKANLVIGMTSVFVGLILGNLAFFLQKDLVLQRNAWINPSILGLTVLAWGNSIGDLISNVTMALNGGKDGAQMAILSCYADPLFNTLIGLGVSLVLASWSEYPSSYVLPKDPFLCQTLGFLMVGLL
ncbi:hypothetical protein RND71_002032 [Anisodus tanguticus]|uniref:Sodium/calcium exchanger membrane region domain-containing protein n=1 Tax=Anisodus tanguticus TaxID=243964 RepID=A0AAE1VYT8_9SOLA|nr:hypothetical protein RND71_002032 [Anisodus tanguticus]